MEVEPFENPWIKKIRVLTHLLLLSVALNVAFVTSVIVNRVRTRPSLAAFTSKEKKQAFTLSNSDVIKQMFHHTFEELVSQLDCSELIQDGFSRRDLALAYLTTFHHFDLSRAIVGKQLQRRQLTFIHSDGGEEFSLEVYPALNETDFQLIREFARRERWPLTTEGLFEELKKQGFHANEMNNALVQAFVASTEFYTLYTLFRRKSEKVYASEILQMVLEGPWEIFADFTAAQKGNPDLSEEQMRHLLMQYVHHGGTIASLLWLKLDSEYVLRGLDDQGVQKVIQPITQTSPTVTAFLKQLLCSVRSDEVRKTAGMKLYALEKLPIPRSYSHEATLRQFMPEVIKALPVKNKVQHTKTVVSKEAKPALRVHVVRDGDSLWKIAKKYGISINQIRQTNRLKYDRLRPGQKITIPAKS